MIRIFVQIGISNLTLFVPVQTVHWIGAQFVVCMFVVSREKSLSMFQKGKRLHLQNFRELRVQLKVTQILLAQLFFFR